MLSLPTTSETRFNRTLFDVDRTEPSPFGWKHCSRAPCCYVRRMGLVESLHNTMPVLPSKLNLPCSAGEGNDAKLEVGEDLMFGVRTRAGEAFGTPSTFCGQLNLELGHDMVVWDTDKMHKYLTLMKYIVEAIVAYEQDR